MIKFCQENWGGYQYIGNFGEIEQLSRQFYANKKNIIELQYNENSRQTFRTQYEKLKLWVLFAGGRSYILNNKICNTKQN